VNKEREREIIWGLFTIAKHLLNSLRERVLDIFFLFDHFIFFVGFTVGFLMYEFLLQLSEYSKQSIQKVSPEQITFNFN
jgi:hypothetical protein